MLVTQQYYKKGNSEIEAQLKPVVLPAEEFDGEHQVNSWRYLAVLWIVSILAAVTNVLKAFARKVLNPKKSFKRILWDMGRDEGHVSSPFVDRFSQFNHQSKTGAAGWKSLKIFYNYNEWVKPQLNGNFEGALTRYWIEKMHNRQAVTNRKKMVVQFIADAFRQFADLPEIRLVSVASGSAEAVVDAMNEVLYLNIRVILIDNDLSALAEAKESARKSGFLDRFEFIEGTTTILEDVCIEFQPHIIEMVGFLDYRPHHKAIELVGRIYNLLPEGGRFLTCNICPNSEKAFLDWVLLWPMIYRKPETFSGILDSAGFKKRKIFLEPHKIHTIGVCEK